MIFQSRNIPRRIDRVKAADPWLRACLLLALPVALLALSSCKTPPPGAGGPGATEPGAQAQLGAIGKLERMPLKTGIAKPQRTAGAPYPPAPKRDSEPNKSDRYEPVPTGPRIGSLKPLNAPMKPVELTLKPKPERRDRSLRYTYYSELTNAIPSTSGCCPEMSVAENGRAVMITGNTWMGLSSDGGASFTVLDPTTIFPQSDGGLCCDQVVQYIPRYDLFVWLMQYWASGDNNRIRIAVQSTPDLLASGGTAWTYWDFVSDTFHPTATLDYNDMSFGNTFLYWTSQIDGRVVVRVPLQELAARTTVNFGYTGGTDALWSHVTHNASDAVFWAGHVNNSQLRVFSMRDSEGFYSWRTVNINSWPNGTNTSLAPDGTDWMTFESWKHYVYGNAKQGRSVWFGWLASAGGGFPQPHVQLVKLNSDTFAFEEQVQVWNPDFAFLDPYLSTNAQDKLGMSIAFGGGPYYASHAVGVWGDFVVYYPRLSTRATSRWGDYNTARRSGSNGLEWAAAGYTNERDAGGNPIQIPHFIRFDH
jgi:hypothetical protein